MSAAQFMPSNYRKLGIDYNGDGQTDLWSLPDAIGSIARYLTRYDPQRSWKRGMPMVVRAHLTGPLPADFPRNETSAFHHIGDLRAAGVVPDVPLPDSLRAGLIELPRASGTEEWIALENFYSVMSYNPQVFYAMSVAQLAEQLAQAQGSGGS
jgi:membrane-bound lytic murein transglycosylase B